MSHNLKKSDQLSADQMRVYTIYKGLAKYELVHLAKMAGLDAKHYSSQLKRAAGLTVIFFANIGLTASVKARFDRIFQ